MTPRCREAGWEQTLLVTFRAPARDLGEIIEDMAMNVPDAHFQCEAREASADAGLSDVVAVRMHLPDDAAMLSDAMQVIFHGQTRLRPKIRVRRVLGASLQAAAA